MSRRIDWPTHAVEFLLVIVGILIALAIDNWNHEREESAREYRLLGQLHQDISRDLDGIESFIDARKSSVAAFDKVISMIESNSDDPAEFSDAMATILVMSRFSFRRGAYEIIKSGEVHLSDEDLRIALSDYYEYDVPLSLQGVEDLEITFTGYWIPTAMRYAEEWNYQESFMPFDLAEMMSDREFLQLAKTDRSNHASLNQALIPLAEKMRALLKQIDVSRESLPHSP